MKKLLIITVLLFAVASCTPTPEETKIIQEVQGLILNEEDLQEIGMTLIENGCLTEEYQTSEYSPLEHLSTCNYTINSLEETEVVVELRKYTNLHDLNGTYQYSSSHLFSAEGLISEDEFGDQSKFRVNSEHDYGGEFNEPNIYYYNLWITKDLYLIHVTSKGSGEAKSYIERIGQRILNKFE